MNEQKKKKKIQKNHGDIHSIYQEKLLFIKPYLTLIKVLTL